jgi:hypothetical protein
VYRKIEKDWFDLINSQINLNFLALILQNPAIQKGKERQPFLCTEKDYEKEYQENVDEIRKLNQQIVAEFGMQDPIVNILNFLKSINRCIDNGWISPEYVYGLIGGNIQAYWSSLYLLVYHISYEDHYPLFREFKSLVDKMDKVRIERQSKDKS